MSDRSIEPLMALLGQAERERDEALTLSLKAAQAHQAAQSQAEQLVAYRAEYEARFRDQFSRQNAIHVLQGYQGFNTRLGEAIEQQQRIVAHAEGRAEAACQRLREQEMRVASVRKLIERRMQELRLAADRRDQKQTDEFASRLAWSRMMQKPSAA